MKVRSDLENKIRTSFASIKATTPKETGSFKEIIQNRSPVTPSASTTGKLTVSMADVITGAQADAAAKAAEEAKAKQLAARQPHTRTEWTHHANARKFKKEITLEQANRLAKFAPIINECSTKYNVPKAMICAVILQESGGNPKAVSPVGARGLMQLMPQTAKRFGVKNITDPRQNVEAGTKYLRFLLDRFKGDYKLALAGYNSGEHNVEKYGNTIPPFAETRNYVPSVLAYADTIHKILNQPATPQQPATALPPNAKRA